MTDMTPTPEFREARRAVLGGDDPATVLGAMARGDQRIGEVREMHRRLIDATTAEERKEVVESLQKEHEAVREAIRQGLRDGLTRGEMISSRTSRRNRRTPLPRAARRQNSGLPRVW